MNLLRRAAMCIASTAITLALAACGGSDESDPSTPVPTAVVPPLAFPGPYAVACSNVAQDFSRVAGSEEATAYWQGSPSATGAPQYITDLLADEHPSVREEAYLALQRLQRQGRPPRELRAVPERVLTGTL